MQILSTALWQCAGRAFDGSGSCLWRLSGYTHRSPTVKRDLGWGSSVTAGDVASCSTPSHPGRTRARDDRDIDRNG